MNNTIKWFGIIAFTVVIIFSIVSCGNGNGNLAGIWELESVVNGSRRDVVERIEFFKDGSGSMDGVSITWKTEGNRMMVTAFGQAQTESFKLSGSTLTFASDQGVITVYKKKINKSSNKAGVMTINNIPSMLNGMYIGLIGGGWDDEVLPKDVIGGFKSYNTKTNTITLVKIENGTAEIPIWIVADNGKINKFKGDYSESHLELEIFDAPTINSNSNSNNIGIIEFDNDSVDFVNGSITLFINDGDIYMNHRFFEREFGF